uniref:Uncharacterized protein n=1 Tax=Mastacembelus armatus TaxID=205130 RepID=A0A3Q3MA72_9TELE
IVNTQGKVHSYPPLSVGVSPNSVHRPTDMSRELRTVTTAARARPHLDFTMSILPVGRKRRLSIRPVIWLSSHSSVQCSCVKIIPAPERNSLSTLTHLHSQSHHDRHGSGSLAPFRD